MVSFIAIIVTLLILVREAKFNEYSMLFVVA